MKGVEGAKERDESSWGPGTPTLPGLRGCGARLKDGKTEMGGQVSYTSLERAGRLWSRPFVLFMGQQLVLLKTGV